MVLGVWQPLWARLAGRDGGLREGVPAVLEQPLREWIVNHTRGDEHGVERIRRRLGLYRDDDTGEAAEWLAYRTRPRDLLNITDAVLSLPPRVSLGVFDAPNEVFVRAAIENRRRSLQEMLDDVRSVYTVKENGRGLERRAGMIVTAARMQAVTAAAAKPDAGSAARHLAAAWSATHALRPDPMAAYSEAVKAVEAAVHAVAEPANTRATLGTMIGELRANPGRFSIALAGRSGTGDVSAVTAMLALLWDGQTSRHGGQTPTRPETLEEARMAVCLAITLVECFVSGAVRRT
jgi:hypothetical protein